jgi:hypothetical protein
MAGETVQLDRYNSTLYTSFSTLKRVEKEWKLQVPPARKVYLSNPKRSSGNALGVVSRSLSVGFVMLLFSKMVSFRVLFVAAMW